MDIKATGRKATRFLAKVGIASACVAGGAGGTLAWQSVQQVGQDAKNHTTAMQAGGDIVVEESRFLQSLSTAPGPNDVGSIATQLTKQVGILAQNATPGDAPTVALALKWASAPLTTPGSSIDDFSRNALSDAIADLQRAVSRKEDPKSFTQRLAAFVGGG